MTNLEEIDEIENIFRKHKDRIPNGKFVELLQLRMQMIIAKELCKLNLKEATNE